MIKKTKVKSMFSIMIIGILMFSSMLLLTGCGETEYVAAAEFYYSSDSGATYGNRTKEFNVGETVYMQLIVKVESTNDKLEDVCVTLTIPKITAVDAKYYDGQPITPVYDSVNNITTYTFTITTSKNATEWNFIFQYVPNTEAEITTSLEFDDKVDAKYDKQNTIMFVNAE